MKQGGSVAAGAVIMVCRATFPVIENAAEVSAVMTGFFRER
jgi:hypothetical protein